MAAWAGHVHAFEPVPDLYHQLEGVADAHPNVTAHPLALGDKDGRRRMWVSSGFGDGSSSLLEPKLHVTLIPAVSFPKMIEVEVTTLAAWAKRVAAERIDGAWLDMQGAELAALQGAGALLDQLQAIVLEASFVEFYDGCPLWPDVRDWLQVRGFRVQHEAFVPGELQGNVLVTR